MPSFRFPRPFAYLGAALGLALLAGRAAAAPQWTLVWSDEFNGAANAPVDTSFWNFDTGAGGWGNNELQTYTNLTANVRSDGAGNLLIQANLTAGSSSCSGSFSSGRINTGGKITHQYGYVEARMQLPAGKGIWPAFWMLGNDIGSVGWPACGENDVMENIGADSSTDPLEATVYGSLHGPPGNPGWTLTGSKVLPAGQYVWSGYHTYAVQWSPNQIKFLVDGVVYQSRTPADLGGTNTWVFEHPFFLIMNLAVGGNWPGCPTALTVFPKYLSADYVRVYKQTDSYAMATPYGGTPWPIPGKVECENYDQGGQGIAYNTLTSTNSGGQYRSQGVGIEACADAGGGYDVGWTSAGQWLQYTVKVAQDGLYTLNARVACGGGGAGGSFHYALDGLTITPQLTVPNTGGWQNWQTLSVSGITLTAGLHRLLLIMDHNGAGGMGNFNYTSFTLDQAGGVPTPTTTPYAGTPYGGTAPNLPGTVQAEAYDLGGSGVAWFDTGSGNSGGAYRADGVDIEACGDAGGGYDVGWTDTGEWLNYTVNASGGLYSLGLRLACNGGGGTLHVEVDGQDVTGSIRAPNTGGWQAFTTTTLSGITLSAGTHVLRVVMDTVGTSGSTANFNSMIWTLLSSYTPTVTPTRSPTPSASPSPSASRTATPSPSPTATGTGSPTGTPSPSATATRSGTPTATPSASATASASPSPLPGSPTDSPTQSPSFSASPSFSQSPTASDSPTPTATPSETPSASPSFSPTSSRSASPSPSPSATPTESRTASPTRTATSSHSPSPTPSPSWTASPLVSPTPSPTPGGGLGAGAAVLALQPLPNPNPSRLALELSGPAEGGRLALYSPALALLRQAELGPGLQAGWNNLALPGGLLEGLPNGLYFSQVEVRSDGKWGPASRPRPLVLLR